jgi:hypothetical protein
MLKEQQMTEFLLQEKNYILFSLKIRNTVAFNHKNTTQINFANN